MGDITEIGFNEVFFLEALEDRIQGRLLDLEAIVGPFADLL
jgi:hypothetical protein